MVTHQLQVERRTGKVRRPETDVLPLCHATAAYDPPGKSPVGAPECCSFVQIPLPRNPPEGSGYLPETWSFGAFSPTQVDNSNVISIRSAVIVQLSNESNRQTHAHQGCSPKKELGGRLKQDLDKDF